MSKLEFVRSPGYLKMSVRLGNEVFAVEANLSTTDPEDAKREICRFIDQKWTREYGLED